MLNWRIIGVLVGLLKLFPVHIDHPLVHLPKTIHQVLLLILPGHDLLSVSPHLVHELIEFGWPTRLKVEGHQVVLRPEPCLAFSLSEFREGRRPPSSIELMGLEELRVLGLDRAAVIIIFDVFFLLHSKDCYTHGPANSTIESQLCSTSGVDVSVIIVMPKESSLIWLIPFNVDNEVRSLFPGVDSQLVLEVLISSDLRVLLHGLSSAEGLEGSQDLAALDMGEEGRGHPPQRPPLIDGLLFGSCRVVSKVDLVVELLDVAPCHPLQLPGSVHQEVVLGSPGFIAAPLTVPSIEGGELVLAVDCEHPQVVVETDYHRSLAVFGQVSPGSLHLTFPFFHHTPDGILLKAQAQGGHLGNGEGHIFLVSAPGAHHMAELRKLFG